MCDNLSLFKCGQKIMYTYTEVGYIARILYQGYPEKNPGSEGL